MRITAVIFDMDGLVLDTEPLYRAACQQAAAELGYTLSDAIHSRLMGRNTADAEQVVLDEFGPRFPIEAFRDRCQKLEAAFEGAPLPKKHGLDELLALLDSRGVPKAVATSTQRKIAVPTLAATGLLDRFDVITTGDEVTNGKPAPDLFLLAAERLGIDPAMCLVLEDAEPGVIAAHSAGMQVYMVPDLQPSSATAERLARGIFDSLVVVAKHLELVLLNSRRPASTKGLEPFNTDRLVALPIRAEDLQGLCLMHQDPEVMKTLGGVRNEEETNRWLCDNLDHWNVHGFGLWMFRHRADGRFVGRCGLRRVQLDSGNEVELAYALVRQYWGMGLATEMAKAVVAIGFEQLGLGNLIALVDAANTASRSVTERLGFHFERNTMWKSLLTMLYRLERGQWTKT